MTPLGKFVVVLFILGLVGAGFWMMQDRPADTAGAPTPPTSAPAAANPAAAAAAAVPVATAAAIAAALESAPPVVATQLSVPVFPPAGTYAPKDGIIEVSLSEYPGYAGLIVANGGLEPNADSLVTRATGKRFRIRLTEEDTAQIVHAGKVAVSATTTDVLAVYGRQYQAVVPALISYSRGADAIITRAGLNRINDLKGKVLITAQFTESDFLIRYLGQEAGLPVRMLAEADAPLDPTAINLLYAADTFAAADRFLADVQAGSSRLAGCITWSPKSEEIPKALGAKGHVLMTNRNLLVVSDILVVNRGFAEADPAAVNALVLGLLEGNRLVRDQPEAQLPVIAKAFSWTVERARDQLSRIHFANLPENRAYFAGTMDAAGSFQSIYQSAILAYGADLIPNPVDADRFASPAALTAAEQSGKFAGQTVAIAPIKTVAGSIEDNPILAKNIRFAFLPNTSDLDMASGDNVKNLASLQELLRVSPGSNLLLRGHSDPSKKEEFRQQGGESFVRTMALKAMELSKARAVAVRQVMIDQLKIDPKRIEAVGRGWEEPLGSDMDANRRVEVQWFMVE